MTIKRRKLGFKALGLGDNEELKGDESDGDMKGRSVREFCELLTSIMSDVLKAIFISFNNK